MLKSSVSCTWEHIVKEAELFDASESLEVRSIDELPYLFTKRDEAMHVIIDFSLSFQVNFRLWRLS